MPGKQERSRLVLETAAKVVALSRLELIERAATDRPRDALARRPNWRDELERRRDELDRRRDAQERAEALRAAARPEPSDALAAAKRRLAA